MRAKWKWKQFVVRQIHLVAVPRIKLQTAANLVFAPKRTVWSVRFSGSDEFHSLASHMWLRTSLAQLHRSAPPNLLWVKFSAESQQMAKNAQNFTQFDRVAVRESHRLLSWVKFYGYIWLVSHASKDLILLRLTKWTSIRFFFKCFFFSYIYSFYRMYEIRFQGSHMCTISPNSQKMMNYIGDCINFLVFGNGNFFDTQQFKTNIHTNTPMAFHDRMSCNIRNMFAF